MQGGLTAVEALRVGSFRGYVGAVLAVIHDPRWREPGHSANVKALGKWRSYKGARRRQE